MKIEEIKENKREKKCWYQTKGQQATRAT